MAMYEIYERLRNERGLSNADVSRATGVSTATLSQWKTGKYTPKQDKLEKIAAFLAVPAEYITSGTVSATDSETARMAEYIIENETVRLIVENIKELDEKERAWVLEAVRLIYNKKNKAPHGN